MISYTFESMVFNLKNVRWAFLFGCLLITSGVWGQLFKKTYKLEGWNECAMDAAELSDGSLVMVGYTTIGSDFGSEVVVVKTSASGDLLWVKKIGGKYISDRPTALTIGRNDEIYVLGNNWFGNSGGNLAKLTASGSLLWTKTITHGTVNEFTDVNYRNGILYIVGASDHDTWFVTVNESGTVLQNKVLALGAYEFCNKMSFLSDNTIAVCGKTGVNFYNMDSIYVLKMDTVGSLLWCKYQLVDIVNSQYGVEGYAVAELSSHNIVVTGYGWNSGTWPSTFVLRLDSLGGSSVLTFANGLSDAGSDILPSANDGFYLLMTNCNFGCSSYVLKFNSALNYSMIVGLGKPGGTSYNGFSGASRLFGTKSGHLLISGYYAYGDDSEMLLMKCDSTGSINYNPVITLQTPPPGSKFCEGDSVLLVAPSGFDRYQWCINLSSKFVKLDVNNDSIYIKKRGEYYCSVWTGNNILYSAVYDFRPNPQVKNIVPIVYGNKFKFCEKASDSVMIYSGMVHQQMQWCRNGTPISGATGNSLIVKQSGFYSIYVSASTSACDTGMTAPVYIDANYVPQPVIRDSNVVVAGSWCNQLNGLVVGPFSGCTYEWTVDNKTTAYTSNFLVSPNQPGLYECIVSNACGARRSAPRTVVTGVQGVSVGNDIQYYGQSTGCGVGSSVQLSAPIGSSGPYQWKRNNQNLPNQTSGTYTATQNGTYTLLYYSPTCHSAMVTEPLVIKLNTTAPVLSAPSGTTSCNGSLPLAVTPVGLGLTYEWYRDNVPVSSLYGQTNSMVSKPGKYRCKVYNPACGTQYTNELEIFTGFVKPELESETKIICQGDSALIVCKPYGSFGSYQWYRNGSLLAGVSGNSCYVKDSGSYVCQVTTACGVATSSPLLLQMKVLPPLVSTVTPGVVSCKSVPVTIGVDFIPGARYNWTNSNGWQMATVYSNSIMVELSSTYYLTATIGHCVKTLPPVAVTILNGSSEYIYTNIYRQICNGEQIQLSASPWQGNTYQWYKNGVQIQNATDTSYTTSSPGNYYVRISGTCGQFNTEPVNVTVKPKPTAVVTAGGPLSFCSGDSLQLQVSSNNPYSYQWKRNGSIIPNEFSSSFYAKLQGSYRAGVYSPYGCLKESATLQVTVPCRLEDELPTPAMLYPNPSKDFTDLFLPEEVLSGETMVEVTDVSGRIVPLAYVKEGDHIRFYAADEGVYLIKVISPENSWVEKWLLTR